GGGTARIVATLMEMMGRYSDSLWYFILLLCIVVGLFGSLTEFWMAGDWSGIPRVKDEGKRKPEDNIGIQGGREHGTVGAGLCACPGTKSQELGAGRTGRSKAYGGKSWEHRDTPKIAVQIASTSERGRFKVSILPSALANINIDKSSSVYSQLAERNVSRFRKDTRPLPSLEPPWSHWWIDGEAACLGIVPRGDPSRAYALVGG